MKFHALFEMVFFLLLLWEEGLLKLASDLASNEDDFHCHWKIGETVCEWYVRWQRERA